jgi:hypothetical protein
MNEERKKVVVKTTQEKTQKEKTKRSTIPDRDAIFRPIYSCQNGNTRSISQYIESNE